jgi:transcriptional regulator of acetoin/glycerol metabolism
MVESNEFRSDLLARIRGLVIQLPRLAERLEDIGLILSAITHDLDAEQLRMSRRAGMALFGYRWPHNIRELAKCIKVSSALSDDGIIHLDHLPEFVRSGDRWAEQKDQAEASRGKQKRLSQADRILRNKLVMLLEQKDGNIAAVGREMNKARSQIQRWVKRLEIDVEACREPGTSSES